MHQIVIVGGGAGGLELATRLGDRLGRRRRAAVTLVDRHRTHVWKPLLHEVAAGSMDVHQHQLDYLAQARWHHFTFALGALEGLDRGRREITIGAIRDDRGAEVIPPRTLRYDTLVIAIGSLANPFGVAGVTEHAFALDSPSEADHFNRRLVNAVLRANYQVEPRQRELRVVIVGGGATGVELAAELHNTTRVLAAYGLENIDPERQVKLTLLNADARILGGAARADLAGDDRSARGARRAGPLQRAGGRGGGRCGAHQGGKTFPADLTVWAAGIKAADVLRGIDGLETNRLNQLVVLPTLQTTRDPDVFALGDCAACPWEGREGNVPARAQAAHQQASHLVRTIERRLAGRAPGPWRYRDFGSLVSLGEYSTVGTLMGFLSGPSIRVEGWFARLMYVSLYKMHLLALHGWWRVVVDTLARTLRRGVDPRVKLH